MRTFLVTLAVVAVVGCARPKGPAQTLDKYGTALKNHDFGSAYDFMSSGFRGKVSREDYVRMMRDNVREVDETSDRLRGKKGSGRQVRVVGHADASGTPEANQALSVKRAESVKEYLVQKGADPTMLVVVGQGSKDPANPGNPMGAENRRVEIGRQTPQ